VKVVTSQVTGQSAPVRAVTDEELATFRRQGWAKLENFIPAEVAGEMLAHAKKLMGADAGATAAGVGQKNTWNDYYYLVRDGVEPFRSVVFSQEIGANAQRVMGRQIGVRYSSDMLAVKVPKGPGGGSAQTNWHQDFPNFAHDRVGNTSFWIALDDVPPERGSMRFLTGSHVEGPLGRTLRLGSDLTDIYPELKDRYEVSPPVHLRPGDATVHHSLVCHYAPENTTDHPRWAFIASYFPADVLYNGAKNHTADPLGLTPEQPFDHPNFPIIYP
jgi:ectoine hydroxylase-related dioxygenase (phytanoyl-CoA dioxygenase family)